MSTWSLIYQQSVFKRYHSDKYFSEFLPTRWRQKLTGMDMEQNYVTVALCVYTGKPSFPAFEVAAWRWAAEYVTEWYAIRGVKTRDEPIEVSYVWYREMTVSWADPWATYPSTTACVEYANEPIYTGWHKKPGRLSYATSPGFCNRGEVSNS